MKSSCSTARDFDAFQVLFYCEIYAAQKQINSKIYD